MARKGFARDSSGSIFVGSRKAIKHVLTVDKNVTRKGARKQTRTLTKRLGKYL